MLPARRAIALAVVAGSLVAAPSALARTSPVGNSSGSPTQNVCVADIQCTYVNFKDGRPTDVVGRTGTVRSWTVRAASVGGTVRLRILRRTANGRFRFVRSSVTRKITDDVNTFPASIPVRRGDVLALTNTTSGIYMAAAPGRAIRYFNFDRNQSDGAVGRTDRSAPALRLLLSARVSF